MVIVLAPGISGVLGKGPPGGVIRPMIEPSNLLGSYGGGDE